MDEKKTRSIWDEVDALQKEKEQSAEGGKGAENTVLEVVQNENVSVFSNKDSSQNGLKENKNTIESTREKHGADNRFEFRIERDDNAKRKGFLSILALILCTVVLIGATLGIVNIILLRNTELKASREEMDRLDKLKSFVVTDTFFAGGIESVLDENVVSIENTEENVTESEETPENDDTESEELQ